MAEAEGSVYDIIIDMKNPLTGITYQTISRGAQGCQATIAVAHTIGSVTRDEATHADPDQIREISQE